MSEIINASSLTQYSDGSYSAMSIKHSRDQGNTCSKYIDDVKNGKVRFIGELHCFDEKGEYKIFRNLKSEKFN
ncbi:MAG: hypothetical protein A2998_01175 [Candidatus Staskawiczbacteria bacterium RIFCSPLOWO2_01_FULL_37_25b]|uniref:Uncharacterized protein n=2 Tax=Candidatus Staskawicziibacteriota TaxID=1817916 RepID=A0A1G2HRP0_9BACT|nr:MAG: hypothetical protein A2812_02860 [Candidatus Staskawiczbacteria bacterium RIFCSPHIGHO2_01_FULL_36_16]OGZ72380.1 MAG: hypothetical protein A2998_01175 [Candidatus Staskawiczbacteria bacterium RIFCSPLOWO2_01_FULL_37_25b]